MTELPNYYCLEVPVPGMSKHDLTLRLENNLLIIEGKRQYEGKSNGSQSEIKTNYRRSMTVPIDAAVDQIKAKVKNGMLIIKIYKQKQHDNIRTIPVSGDKNKFLTKNNIWTGKLVQNLTKSFRKLF